MLGWEHVHTLLRITKNLMKKEGITDETKLLRRQEKKEFKSQVEDLAFDRRKCITCNRKEGEMGPDAKRFVDLIVGIYWSCISRDGAGVGGQFRRTEEKG